MATVKLTDNFIKEHPNILYVMECYFSDVEEIGQENGVITYRVWGVGLPDDDTEIKITIDNTDGFLQIIEAK